MTPNVLYGIYYVCRLSMNIVRKPIVEDGVFSETELGIIGSCLFFVYAVGKLTNGFLADRSNVRRFMSTDLLCSALIHLLLGFTNSFYAFVLLWGLNGWFQSMGAASCVSDYPVGLKIRNGDRSMASGRQATTSGKQ